MCVMRGLTKRKHSHPRNSGRSRLDIVDDKSVMDGDVLPETILLKANDAATPVFLGRTAEIDAVLCRIRGASDDHLFVRSEEGHWGHVTVIADQAVLIRLITNEICGKGGADLETSACASTPITFPKLTDDRGYPILGIYSILDRIPRLTKSGFRPV